MVNRTAFTNRWLGVTIGLVLLAAGCADGPAAPPLTAADVVGTYALVAVESQPLPWTRAAATSIRVVADTLRFHAGGTAEAVNYVVDPATGTAYAPQRYFARMQWALTSAGDSLTVVWQDGDGRGPYAPAGYRVLARGAGLASSTAAFTCFGNACEWRRVP